LAQALSLEPAQIRVIHQEGPGCYGHNGADDAALDAALLALAVPNRPVRLQWERADEHGWEPYGPAMAVDLRAGLDRDGKITAWDHQVWSYPQMGRPRPLPAGSSFIAAWHRAEALPPPARQAGMGRHGGSHRNADPLYRFPRRVLKHFNPESPLRTSSLRGLGAYMNVFAIESFMDELALAAGQDPVAFRLAYLEDPRARAVLEAVAEKSGWVPQVRPGGTGRGRGVAFAQYKNQKTYAAVVIELSVAAESGEIHLEKGWIAADAGQIINPDGLRNQLEGGLIQSASWTLKESVQFDDQFVTSLDWETYPILRFSEVPQVETVLLDQPGLPPLGSGEATQGPTGAAIANALFDAAGVRLRKTPFSPARVRAALQNN
jgi:CO/xanthine dehydrogenase Mo-binding subunit